MLPCVTVGIVLFWLCAEVAFWKYEPNQIYLKKFYPNETVVLLEKIQTVFSLGEKASVAQPPKPESRRKDNTA